MTTGHMKTVGELLPKKSCITNVPQQWSMPSISHLYNKQVLVAWSVE